MPRQVTAQKCNALRIHAVFQLSKCFWVSLAFGWAILYRSTGSEGVSWLEHEARGTQHHRPIISTSDWLNAHTPLQRQQALDFRMREWRKGNPRSMALLKSMCEHWLCWVPITGPLRLCLTGRSYQKNHTIKTLLFLTTLRIVVRVKENFISQMQFTF